MLKYIQYIKENQHYLTDPWDPEFSLNYKFDSMKKTINTIKEKIEEVAKKLNLNVEINETRNELEFYFSTEYSSIEPYYLYIDGIEGKIEFTHPINTIGELEEELKNIFSDEEV